ncbi:HNH endonuclease [Salinicoccus albus]|uniref:HNH endonuclease n=1 Tax=Salinicoccus albus TaxID=418756 RepID=UPI000371E3D8|nr:HNH endonuclease signature motif containing protein [Salinicoccus albus]
MTAKIDLTGGVFNRLTVMKDAGRNKHNQVMWLCKCECGNKVKVITTLLRRGLTKSCGCLQKEKASNNTGKDLTGKRFGKLIVLKRIGTKTGKNGRQGALWECGCDCGGKVNTITTYLTTGGTRSCGCIQREGARERLTGENHYNFNPHLTDEERLKHRYILSGGTAESWRNSVYKRDNYTCQVCGDKNGNGKRIVLNAHHMDGWNWSEKGRFDVGNGVTLCKSCHDDFHNKYGNKDNTKEQFKEYIKALV